MRGNTTEDADYLVKTKLSPDYLTFETLLKEAFRIERGSSTRNKSPRVLGLLQRK